MTLLINAPKSIHSPSSHRTTAAPMWRTCRATLAAAILLLATAANSQAKGGDAISPFPISDARADVQEAKAMAVDSAGNLIIVGSTNSGGTNNNYQITKFKADGTGLAWPAVTYDRAGGDDTATAVVVDGNGDIIVTGYSSNGTNYDIQTLKYAGTSGALLWQQTYAGVAGGSDYATAITVDSGNNVYVAGYSFNGTSNDDALLIKYPAAGGGPVWTRSHDETYQVDSVTYHSNDRFSAIAAGPDGIAVTGYTSKGIADFDLLTRKYDLTGTLIREWRKSSAGSGDDRGVAVTLDTTGTPLVTGTLTNGTHTDIYTAKCSLAADNATIWERSYDGGFDDKPAALAVTADGDLYVTGDTFTLNGHEDFYTVRYQGSSGNTVWDSIYHSGSENDDIPVAIVVSEKPTGDNGVFITGYATTASNDNIITLKYLQTPPTDKGVLLWQSSFNGAANKNDRPVGIGLASLTTASDPLVGGWSNTIATALDFQALRYDHGPLNAPNSLVAAASANDAITLVWRDTASNEDGFKIERKLGASGSYSQIGTVGANSTSFNDSGLTANSYYYYRVRAYNSSNGDSAPSNEAHALTKVVSYDNPTWSYIYNGPDNREDRATGIIVDSDDHPVVTGYSELAEEGVSGTYSFDYLTMKLDRGDRSSKWLARYDSGGEADMAAGVALDSSGNAIVTGTAYLMNGGSKSDDLYTRKVATAGVTNPATVPALLWDHQYGTNSGIDLATAVKVSRNGTDQSVVIGHGLNANYDYDIFLIKYNANGSTAWTPAVYNSGSDDLPTDVAFDTAGNILLSGYRSTATGDAWFIAKYNGATGVQLWTKSYAGPGTGSNQPHSLAVDAADNLYVTGFGVNSSGDAEMVTIKYAGSTGAEIWSARHNGSESVPGGDDQGISIALDPIDGAVVVAGTSYRTTSDSDFHLIRYNPADGAVIWERNFDKPVSYEYVSAMAVDSSGYIYVTGTTRSGPDTDVSFDATTDIISLIYDFEGTFLGAMSYNGNGREKAAAAIAVNNQGEAFIAGFGRNAVNPDYLVLKQKNPYLLVPAPLTVTTPADSSTLVVAWHDNSPGTEFLVEQSTTPDNAASWVAKPIIAVGTTSVTSTGLTAGTRYCFRVAAVSDSLSSRPLISCGTTTLAAPTLTALTVDSTTQITLSWLAVSGSSGYKVERKIGAGSWSVITIADADATSYRNEGLSAGTTYSYRISSNSSAGYSLPSGEQSATTKPLPPTLAAPTSISNTKMTLGWNTVTGGGSYTLQAKPAGGSYTDVASCTAIAGTSCSVTGLTPAVAYAFRVKATNPGGDSVWSNEPGATAALPIPTLNAPSAITASSMNLAWATIGLVGTTYTLEYKLGVGGTYGASGCPVNSNTSCTVSGLTPNSTYYFRVKATLDGDSGWSSDQSGKTLLATPAMDSATRISAARIDLAWTGVAGASGYNIERADCKNSDSNPASCDGTTDGNYAAWSSIATNQAGPSYQSVGLSAGTNYRYRIYAVGSGNTSATSAAKHAWTDLPAPTIQSINPLSSTALTLTWDQRSGETKYTIESGPTLTGPWTEIAATQPLNNVSYPHNSLTTGTQYCYRVKAVSTVTTPPPDIYSAAACKTTPPVEPTLSPLTVVSDSQINLSWSTVASALDYEVERCVTTDNNDPIGHPVGACTTLTPVITAPDTVLINAGLNAGNSYRYRVRARYAATEYTAWSNSRWATTTPPAPTLAPPAAATASQLVPSWSNVPGDNGYKLYWKARAGGTCTDDNWDSGGPISQAINATSYTHGGRVPGTWYCYKISANGPPGTPDSGYSAIVSQITKPLAPTLAALANITANAIDLSWNNVSGNTGYQIDRSLDSTNWQTATVSTDITAYTSGGLSAGTRYYFRVSALSASGLSAASTVQSATTVPAPTTATASVVSATAVDISWPVIPGATNYTVWRKEGSGSYGEISNQAVAYAQKYCNQDYPTANCPTLSAMTTTYPDTGLAGNTTYCYQVRTANSSGNSTPSSEQCVTTPAQVATQEVTATALNSFRIRIDWSPLVCGSCATSTGYELERLAREGIWRQIATTTSTTYTDVLAIDPGRRHRYRVRAVSGSATSAYSEASVVTPPYTAGATTCPP